MTTTLYVVIGWEHNCATPRLHAAGMHGDEAYQDREAAVQARDALAAASRERRYTVHMLTEYDEEPQP